MRAWAPILLASVLAACTVFPESESLRLFMLPQSTAATDLPEGPELPFSLRVQSPQASRILGNARIAVVPEGSEISVYSGVRWSEPAGNLLRDRLIEAFLESGRLQAVYDDQNRLPADLQLLSRLRAFQAEYVDGTPQVRIVLDAYLTDSGGQEVIANRRFEISEDSEGEKIERVVESFGRAGDRLSAELVSWALQVLEEWDSK